jgi:UDP-N-acetylglucosamine--N-acetylmuramyl-(pentapeptide) pyrophosphoryl-undecaprenol N-acetylglucosamine transferase
MRGRILIAGGGTGGHIYPAIATLEKLKEKGDFEFLFVGGKKGMEMNLISKYDIPMRSIWISGFQRYFTWKNFLFPLKLMVSMIQSWKIVNEYKPGVVVGTGGYVTGPILYTASKMGVPVLIQEQDVYPGVTTRLLKKHADRICLAFEGAKKYLDDFLNKVVVTGNPVRKNLKIKSKIDAIRKWGFNPEIPIIFVFGGSQGARAINRALVKVIPQLLGKFKAQIIWQTGEEDYTEIKEGNLNSELIKIFPFIHEMDFAYSAADIIVSRAGAITLAELAIVQKPVILVPYPFAAGKHQEHNARVIENEGAAILLLEESGWEERLLYSLEKLLTDQSLRDQMASSWQKLAKPNASDLVAEEIIKLIKTN